MNPASRDLLKELECPVCLQYFTEPITLCNNGHCICHVCRQQINKCPTCRESFARTRCVVLENIVRTVQYPCIYQEHGCTELLTLELLKDHEAVCPVGMHECPLNKFKIDLCDWRGKLGDFRAHVRENHAETRIWENTTFISRTMSTFAAVVFALGEIFLYYKLKRNDKWYFVVMLVGSRVQAAKYKSVFTLQAANGVDGLVETHIVRSFTEDLDDIFRSYRCLQLDEMHLNRFVTKNEIGMSIEISEIKT